MSSLDKVKISAAKYQEYKQKLLEMSKEDLIKEILTLRKDNEVMRLVLNDLSKAKGFCYGCGHDFDEEHKKDCVIFKNV